MNNKQQLQKETKSILRSALTFLFLSILFQIQATTWYVKQGGNGSGTSWADASGNLQAIIISASPGDKIWVAAGTYLPDVPNGSRSATFLIEKNIQVYGGFIGTENTLEERGNPSSHPTILSGDLLGNDSDENDPLNRGDNVLTVLTVSQSISQKTIIDGFTISGGQADDSTSGVPEPANSGGGLYAMGYPVLRNCIFIKNRASQSGGGAYFKSAFSPLVEQCQFLDNSSGDWGGGLYIEPLGGPVEIRSTLFKNNEAVRGGGAALLNQDTRLVSCIFLSNKAIQRGGGFLFIAMDRDNITATVENCVFQDNVSTFGGGLNMYDYVGRKGIHFRLFQCSFIMNNSTSSTPGWGPAGGGALISMSSRNSLASILSCSFTENKSDKYAGGFGAMLYGTQVQLEIEDSEFMGISSESESGAIAVWGVDDGIGGVVVDNCTFENNSSGIGGAVSVGNGFEGSPGNFNFSLTNCTWRENQARLGGALFLWGDPRSTSEFNVKHCLMENNVAAFRAGAIAVRAGGADFDAHLSQSTFRNNQGLRVGAIDVSSFSYTGSAFAQNAKFTMENCLIAGNTSDDAAISGRLTSLLRFTNCTIAGNMGGGIQMSHGSTLQFQNTILYNPGFTEYQERVRSPSFVSKGGNLIGDYSLHNQLTNADLQNTDPQFTEEGDFHLANTSPCLDAGINEGTNAHFDLDGQPRVQGLRVDMGAFESPLITALRETQSGETMVYPNPASKFIQLLLPENLAPQLEIQVFDTSGKIAQQQKLDKRENPDVSMLPAGLYSMKVAAGGRTYTGRFIKL